LLRRRCAEERLARVAVELAQRNAALEDFAALVAHELKAPLLAALVTDEPASQVEQALDLIDLLLAAATTTGPASSAVRDCLDEAVRDLGDVGVEITSDVTPQAPLPAAALRIILRNLLRNATAAGARRIHVHATVSAGSWRLMVDDDGVGLGAAGYAEGSGLGLGLCRRLAQRHRAALELTALPSSGTRAVLALAAA
jgi:signal transduction histidine kinase